jgi:hypothetical protein
MFPNLSSLINAPPVLAAIPASPAVEDLFFSPGEAWCVLIGALALSAALLLAATTPHLDLPRRPRRPRRQRPGVAIPQQA